MNTNFKNKSWTEDVWSKWILKVRENLNQDLRPTAIFVEEKSIWLAYVLHAKAIPNLLGSKVQHIMGTQSTQFRFTEYLQIIEIFIEDKSIWPAYLLHAIAIA